MTSRLAEPLRALAAVGLDDGPELPVTGWDAHFGAVIGHGLSGLLVEAWRRDLVDLDDDVLDRLGDRLQAEARRAVLLEAELLRLAPVLARFRGVVLKGPGLAHGAYPDPSWRPFTDLDLLVPARMVPAAIEILLALGYSRPRPDPSIGFLVRIAKATALEHPSGLVVDLHRTLATGNLGAAVDVDDLLADRIVVDAGAVPVPAPSWPAHLVEVALHAAVGDGMGRALSLRDVVQVAAHRDLDPSVAIALAERWQVADVVAIAMATAHQLLDVAVPTAFAAWVSEGATGAALIGPGSGSQRSARLRLDELRRGGLRRRATLLRSLILPTPTFLRWQFGDEPLPLLYRRRLRHLRRRRHEATPAAVVERPLPYPAPPVVVASAGPVDPSPPVESEAAHRDHRSPP